MNININSNYNTNEMINIRLSPDKVKSGEVTLSMSSSGTIADETSRYEKEKIREQIQQAATMDVSEVKDFLFMLIGAEVKVKPENDKSGLLINRLV